MGKHWVKVKPGRIVTRKNIQGIRETYYPGDWLEVKNMELRALLVRGDIEKPGETPDKIFELSDCGVVITSGGNVNKAALHVHGSFAELPVSGGDGLSYPRTLLWDGKTTLRLGLLPVGFHRLTTGWQIAAPLWSYGELARDIGTAEERQRTEAIIHDLRVPVYHTGMLYVRRCSDTQRLLKAWQEERTDGGDKRLAFMRALYHVKPTMCALPTTWLR